MRQALADQVRPPALLEDSAQRFRLDQEIDRFIGQMAANDPNASAALQLELLSQDHIPDLAGQPGADAGRCRRQHTSDLPPGARNRNP